MSDKALDVAQAIARIMQGQEAGEFFDKTLAELEARAVAKLKEIPDERQPDDDA
jgi:hypothetical protein